VFEAKTGSAPATPPGLARRRKCDVAINGFESEDLRPGSLARWPVPGGAVAGLVSEG
jgi:hypothetical protein